jgi:hypothetical protein
MIRDRQPILTDRYRTERTKQAWAEEQLARVCADVAGSQGGPVPRHTVLYKSACRMGPYVREAVIDYALVHARLTAAATAAGLDRSRAGEVRRTIRDGCERGGVHLAWYPPSVVGEVEFAVRDGLIRGIRDRRRRDHQEWIRQHRDRYGGQQ